MTSLNDQQLLQKAQQGQGRAQFELATRLTGKAQPDYSAAMHWMKQAAEGGVMAADSATQSRAAAQVATWYEQGLGSRKILSKRVRGGNSLPVWECSGIMAFGAALSTKQ
ncbi:hypothetical protein PCI56_02525 [Plesiomonas shigelloides subsp. oncorhynchi]|nr:hypothetical protein [Plesiomonas shigelloides]